MSHRKRPRQRFSQYLPGYQTTFAGWKLTLLAGNAVKVENPSHSDTGSLVGSDPVSGPIVAYQQAERVPRSVRAHVKSIIRKSLARSLQES